MAAYDAAARSRNGSSPSPPKSGQVPVDGGGVPANRVRVGNQEIPFPTWSSRPISPRPAVGGRFLQDAEDPLGSRQAGRGTPFYYYSYGASCAEVSIDTLTGEYLIDRTDILHDVGRSLNPAIDIGQVEGAFVQGMGWLTTEELWWDAKGRLRTHAPSTYKIPLASDRPKIFNVAWPTGPKTPSHHPSLQGRRRTARSCWRSRCWKRCRWRSQASPTTRSARGSTPRQRRSGC
jgi:xanthine dehydrogenase large subunit